MQHAEMRRARAMRSSYVRSLLVVTLGLKLKMTVVKQEQSQETANKEPRAKSTSAGLKQLPCDFCCCFFVLRLFASLFCFVVLLFWRVVAFVVSCVLLGVPSWSCDCCCHHRSCMCVIIANTNHNDHNKQFNLAVVNLKCLDI